ncbi:MAG: ABC transporter permease subunit [Candidatus Fervidibacter sp.]|uniref:ABC transporter permease subunit n=1 Tax=Candidatus Fervidibacter sp. TaxID=3100871 RepID=UPI0040490415
MTAVYIVWGSLKQITGFPLRLLHNASSLIIGNPVVSREMKVRMRFARSFWLQGAYLLFLTTIVLSAYRGTLAHSPLQHPAELQERLIAFYYTLLYSLVTVIVLVAPALTASAISFERELRTLDLLLTTPLRPMQILFGKLTASFAFLILLLVESMPVIAVCITMGGVTISDLLATYVLIGFSTLHLCAFAMYCSACNRSSGAATFWAYLGVIAILGANFWMALFEFLFGTAPSAAPAMSGTIAQVDSPIASLHPFAAPAIKSAPTKWFGVEIPCWILGIVFSLLLTRFWLTATMAKLPTVYHGNFVGSLRRQGLMLTVLAVLTLEALISHPSVGGPLNSRDLTFISLGYMGFAGLFVALFVLWIATFGEREDKRPANDGWFRPLRMFQPLASGALPFVWFWFTALVAVFVGLLVWESGVQPLWGAMAVGFGYCTLCLTFFWIVGRFWSSVVRQLHLARWISFRTVLLINLLPLSNSINLSPAYPFIHLLGEFHPYTLNGSLELFVTYGAVVFAITIALVLVCIVLERRRR